MAGASQVGSLCIEISLWNRRGRTETAPLSVPWSIDERSSRCLIKCPRWVDVAVGLEDPDFIHAWLHLDASRYRKAVFGVKH
jgi:hypothetical protein